MRTIFFTKLYEIYSACIPVKTFYVTFTVKQKKNHPVNSKLHYYRVLEAVSWKAERFKTMFYRKKRSEEQKHVRM